MARSEPTWRSKDAAREVAVSPRQRHRRRERRDREKENRTLGSDGAKDADAACSFVALIIN